MRHWFAAERGWTPDTVANLDWHWAHDHIAWTAARTKGAQTKTS